MAKMVVENFHAYCAILESAPEDKDPKEQIPVDHFAVYKDL